MDPHSTNLYCSGVNGTFISVLKEQYACICTCIYLQCIGKGQEDRLVVVTYREKLYWEKGDGRAVRRKNLYLSLYRFVAFDCLQ